MSYSDNDINDTVLSGKEYLEEGFPIFIALAGGITYYPDYMKVANIDDDEELEIVLKPQNTPLGAWNHDGTPVSGWPLSVPMLDGGLVLGEFDKSSPGLEIFYGYHRGGTISTPADMAVYSDNGIRLSGWSCDDWDCEQTRVSPLNKPGSALDCDVLFSNLEC